MFNKSNVIRPLRWMPSIWCANCKELQESNILPDGCSVFIGAPSAVRRSAGKAIAQRCSCHCHQLPVTCSGCDKAAGLINDNSTCPSNSLGDSCQKNLPGSSGVTASRELAAAPIKAEPCHKVPWASATAIRPPNCASIIGTNHDEGRNANNVSNALIRPALSHNNSTRILVVASMLIDFFLSERDCGVDQSRCWRRMEVSFADLPVFCFWDVLQEFE